MVEMVAIMCKLVFVCMLLAKLSKTTIHNTNSFIISFVLKPYREM